MSLIGDWERALMGINVSGLAPASRYAAIREASDILNSRVSSTMRDVGCDYAEVWALHFRALAWLDKQISAMTPGVVTITDKNLRELQMKWTYGWKEWPIPMAWAVNHSGSGFEPFRPNPTTQKFTLWPDWTFKIEKHNHWAQRTIWNDYLIDGISVLNGVGE